MVDLVVRKAQRHVAVLPGFNFKDGVLHLYPDVSLTVSLSGPRGKVRGKALAPLQGRVLSLDEEEWIVVASGEEHMVRFDLAELFNLDRKTGYVMKFRIEGFGKGNLALPAIPR